MHVREIMTKDVICCTPETSLEQAARLMADRDCGALPVVKDDQEHGRLVGIITDRDIACRSVARGRNPLQMTVGECMSREVVTITPDEELEECCHEMEEHQVRRIPVTDEDGSCVGIVAQADLARQAPEHEVAQVVKDVSRPGEPRRKGR